MRSDLIKSGVDRTPHKALLKALGVTDSEMHKPFIAVVCAASDYVPGHAHLHEISRQVKDGIRNAGGVPFEFFTIGVCDGLAMNHRGMRYSLASRELICDSIEVMLTAHPLDGIVSELRQDSTRYDNGCGKNEPPLYFCKRRSYEPRQSTG